MQGLQARKQESACCSDREVERALLGLVFSNHNDTDEQIASNGLIVVFLVVLGLLDLTPNPRVP